MSSHSALDETGDAGAQGKLVDGTLSFSAPAAAHIRQYLDREGKSVAAIRMAAVRTHCMSRRGYGYSIQEDTKSDDIVIESDGLRLLVDPQSMQYLNGA